MFRRRALRRRLKAAGAPGVGDGVLRSVARALDAGPDGAPCVPPGHAASPLRLALVRLYRFRDLRDLSELRRSPYCTEQQCCNPYHWSRLCKPETPPPPYCQCEMEELKSKEKGDSTEDARRTDHERLLTGSIATDGEEKQCWESEWCRLAYWELSRRVGRQVGVRGRAVDVCTAATCRSGRAGFCLDTLAPPDPHTLEQVRKTRSKIGLGVTISLEYDGVWVYNRSSEPVFVSSAGLDATLARARLVWRVPPAHCLRVFDPRMPLAPVYDPRFGPLDPHSVRISFAKGWGPKYTRQDVTACPCWLEVLLAPPS